MFARIKNGARALFEDIDISPIKDAAKSLIEALEGPGGKELAGGLHDMFGSIFHTLFDPFKGPEGVQKLTSVMHGIAIAMHTVGEAARNVAPLIGYAVSGLAVIGGSGELESGAHALDRIGAGLRFVFDSLTGLGALDPGAMVGNLVKALDIDVLDLESVGTRMIDGLGRTDRLSGAARVVDVRS